MGEFVYLFGGIEKKWRTDRELNAQEEIDGQNNTQRGDKQVIDDAGTGSASLRDIDGLQGQEHFALLHCGVSGHDRAQQYAGQTGPEGYATLQRHVVLRHQDEDEQAEAFDNEPECYQGEAGTVPGEQGAFGSEKNSWIVQL